VWTPKPNFIEIGRISSDMKHADEPRQSLHYAFILALGYGLDERGSRVRLPAGAGNFSLHHRIQNGSGAHPTSYSMGTRGSFPGVKAVGA
jgi:hypothetical protein